MIPKALTIAGSDSGGGAGIQADLKTFSALGVYGASIITALTAQNTREVRAIQDVPAEFVSMQIETVLDDLDIHAIKVGMLSCAEIIGVVAGHITKRSLENVVVDPVMVAKSGDRLLRDDALAALKDELLPRATLITPNLPEAAALLGENVVTDEAGMARCAQRLRTLGARWVLLKGGHLNSDSCPDLLLGASEQHWLHGARVQTRNTHGTGCTLSSAIAAGLARGLDMPKAVQEAKRYVEGAIKASDGLTVGQGHGPVHHFFAQWSDTA